MNDTQPSTTTVQAASATRGIMNSEQLKGAGVVSVLIFLVWPMLQQVQSDQGTQQSATAVLSSQVGTLSADVAKQNAQHSQMAVLSAQVETLTQTVENVREAIDEFNKEGFITRDELRRELDNVRQRLSTEADARRQLEWQFERLRYGRGPFEPDASRSGAATGD